FFWADAATTKVEPQELRNWFNLPEPTTLAGEYRHAGILCAETRSTLEDIFLDAQEGLPINPEEANELVGHIRKSVERNPSVLLSLVRIRTVDEYTYMHSVAVCALMAALARTLGLSETEQTEAATAGLLHDIGK